ncbi:hypothetical protein ACWDR3_28990 [Streptomyces sp. NPDC001002]
MHDACADHALAHGLPDRLEPLATATGTSARMLIYHFGTRDALLRAILGRARHAPSLPLTLHEIGKRENSA